MRCPYCKYENTKVIDSRESESSVRRRRECIDCKKRFTTYERAELDNLLVIKKDLTRESFDRTKVIKGLIKACEKRPIKHEQLEKVTDDIENELRQRDAVEVNSKEVGELIMSKLKELDKVAYIRFASVYREFTDLDQFRKEIKKLIK